MAIKVTSNGRITIPKRLRDALDLRPGNKLKFEQNKNGEILLRRQIAGVDNAPDRFEPFQVTDELRRCIEVMAERDPCVWPPDDEGGVLETA